MRQTNSSDSVSSNSKWPIRLAIASQALSLFVLLYLTNTHYQIKLGILEGKSLCNISEFLNCDIVNASRYASFFGQPLALWGFVTNLVLLIFLLAYQFGADKIFFKTLALAMAVLVVCTSIVMAAISFTLIHALCIFCITAYALSFLTLISILQLSGKINFSTLFESTNLKWSLGFFAAVPMLVTLVNSVTMNAIAPGLDQIITSSINDWKTGKDVNLSNAKGLTKGAEISKAKMVIVEFADFQCIHCRHAQPVFKNFVKSHPDVALIYQSFPLDGNCNPKVEHKGDGHSCDLAKAVYCGWKQSKGWELHDWAFENFGNTELAKMSEYASSIGIDMEAFRVCRDAPETLQAIVDQAKLGDDSGVKGTPTIFVNGRNLSRGSLSPILEAAYNEISKSNNFKE